MPQMLQCWCFLLDAAPAALPYLQNPAYKGKWSAPMVDNPAYKGEWKPRDIPNPDYVKDDAPLTNIGKVSACRGAAAHAGGQGMQGGCDQGGGVAIRAPCLALRVCVCRCTSLAPPSARLQVGAAAIEIWTMDDGYFFDNVVVSNSEAEAAEVRETAWAPKKAVEDAKEKEEQAKAEAERKAAEEKAAAEAAKGPSVEEKVGGGAGHAICDSFCVCVLVFWGQLTGKLAG